MELEEVEDGVAYCLGWAGFSGFWRRRKEGQLVALPEELGLRDWAAERGLFDVAPTTRNKGLRPTYSIGTYILLKAPY